MKALYILTNAIELICTKNADMRRERPSDIVFRCDCIRQSGKCVVIYKF